MPGEGHEDVGDGQQKNGVHGILFPKSLRQD